MDWISVKDSPPEIGQEVLGVHPLGFDAVWVVCVYEHDGNGAKWECSNSGEMLLGVCEPTHWMPLPEPPRG